MENKMTGCIFCKIINKEIASREFFRDKEVVAFHDISPKAPVHILVVPVKHLENLNDIDEKDTELIGKLMIVIKKIAGKTGLAKTGYKVVVNNGEGSGQLIFHLHFHILGGWQKKPHWQV